MPIKVECQIAGGKRIQSPVLVVQGTDAEKAAKAVRQYYEAVIAQDYDKAGRILKEEMGWDEDGMNNSRS